jgi:ABC-2 type transport system permease protein/lipopolysaccharide transport system permease protein
MLRRVVNAEDFCRRRTLLAPIQLTRQFVADLRDLFRYRGALQCIVSSDLKVRYQRSYLGFAWTLLNPFLMMTVLAIVFSTLRGKNLTVFAVFLFSGLLPWGYFSTMINRGACCLISNERLIRKVYVPKLIFPFSVATTAAINMLFAMAALFILLMFFGASVSSRLVILPAAVAILMVFSFGVTLLLMVLNTHFRDIGHMLSVMLRALYFGSPILYDWQEITGIEGRKADVLTMVLMFNPLTHILELFHAAFCTRGEGWPRWPNEMSWGLAIFSAVVSLYIGYGVYRKYEPGLIHRL